MTANAGTWTDTLPITYTYQWARGGTVVATNGPTSSTIDTYPVTAADEGQAISVTVTAADSGGGAPPVTLSTGVVPTPPSN